MTSTPELSDERTITTYVPMPVVKSLLTSRGWRIVTVTERGHREPFTYYVRPGGKTRAEGGKIATDYLWHIEDALEQVIVACADEGRDPVNDRAQQIADEAGVGLAYALDQAIHEAEHDVPHVEADTDVPPEDKCPTCFHGVVGIGEGAYGCPDCKAEPSPEPLPVVLWQVTINGKVPVRAAFVADGCHHLAASIPGDGPEDPAEFADPDAASDLARRCASNYSGDHVMVIPATTVPTR